MQTLKVYCVARSVYSLKIQQIVHKLIVPKRTQMGCESNVAIKKDFAIK